MMNLTKRFAALPLSSTQPLPDLVICHLASWGTITIIGDDKKSYLQGQITSDVVSLKTEQSTLGAHCDGKGKVLSTFRLFHHKDGLAMFQHHSAIEKELVEIKKYAIFSKVEIQESSDICLGIMGIKSNELIQSLTTETVNIEHKNKVYSIEGGTAVQISQYRWLLLITAESAEQILGENSAAILSNETIWDYADIIDSIPRVSAADQLEHIPQAMNLQALGGISFTKGCYTGQETVARAKYRGINKRAMFKLEGYADNTLPIEQTIERQVGDNWRGAGKLLAHYKFTDGKIIALAVLPNNLEPDTAFRFEHAPEIHLKFGELPYSLEE